MIDALYISKARPKVLGLFAAVLIAGFGIVSTKAVPFSGTGGFTQSTTVIDFESFAIGDTIGSNGRCNNSCRVPRLCIP